MHSLFSVCVNFYSTECRLFACLGELPAEGPPPVIEISPDFFVARRSVRAVPRMDHIVHLGRISPLDWQTKPCERAAKAAGTTTLTWIAGGWRSSLLTARLGFFGGKLTGLSTSLRRRRACSPYLPVESPPLRRLSTDCDSLTLHTGRRLKWHLYPLSLSSPR